MTEVLQIVRPDDWHIHLRDGKALATTVAHCARQFARAIVMPNLSPPVYTVEQALAYRERILAHVPAGMSFQPLMTLYLTDRTKPEQIAAAAQCQHLYAAKLYPAHATTGSQFGVTDIIGLYPVLEAMTRHGLPLLVHGEVTSKDVDVFDREARFIEQVLVPIVQRFADLKIIFEHITTEDAVQFVSEAPANIAATITAHHLRINRNAMFEGGIRPHHYCLPVAKREHHRLALIRAATSGHAKFFLGTDSAPHPREKKEHACGCAGIYTAHAALALYAEVFESRQALDKLELFSSRNGAAFYRLSINDQTVLLRKKAWKVPDSYSLADSQMVPFAAGETLAWELVP